jgi:hypothetical protein
MAYRFFSIWAFSIKICVKSNQLGSYAFVSGVLILGTSAAAVGSPSPKAALEDTSCEAPITPSSPRYGSDGSHLTGDDVERSNKRMGPLRVLSKNPRYFSDNGERAVYLAGSHTWNNLVDMDSTNPPRPFRFDDYLSFLEEHGHNLTRLWAWETVRPDDRDRYPDRVWAEPQPWKRTGPGNDTVGLPKFDVTVLNPAYFERLRSRVKAARDRGIYVAVMLFEGWSVQFSAGAESHPLLSANNVNYLGITDPGSVHTLRHARVTDIQKIYVREVLETLADLDNVIYEISNEASPESTSWQYEMLGYVRCLESHFDMPHPVGMTYQYPGGTNATLFASSADWVSPGWDTGHYLTTPEPADGSKVLIADTDHLGGSNFGDVAWVWKSFFRGLNLLYMDRYIGSDSVASIYDQRTAANLRAAIGSARALAESVDIGSFVPSRTLASTGFALEAENAVLVLAAKNERFTVDLHDLPINLVAEWLDPYGLRLETGSQIKGGRSVVLRAPFEGDAILYLRQPEGRSLSKILPKIQSVHRAAMEHVDAWTQTRWQLKALYHRLLTHLHLMVLVGLACLLGLSVGVLLSKRLFYKHKSAPN